LPANNLLCVMDHARHEWPHLTHDISETQAKRSGLTNHGSRIYSVYTESGNENAAGQMGQ
jgi:hypothetical protein